MSTEENSAIVKHTEHIVKVQEIFSVLKEDALTKAVQLPTSLSQTMKFCHRGKPKHYGNRACTNIRVLHTEDMQSIVSYLRYELEIEEITLGLQRL